MADKTAFTVRLPAKAIEMIEKDLIPTGLYGTSRAEVARALIIARLEQLVGEGIVQLRRD
jgi:hypothetical protein